MSYQPHQSEDPTLKPVAMTEREAAAASARPDLHQQIINLQGKDRDTVRHLYRDSVMTAYYAGHRDARHAAAELVAASAAQAVQRPLTEEQIDAAARRAITGSNASALALSAFKAGARWAERHGIVPLAPQDTGEM